MFRQDACGVFTGANASFAAFVGVSPDANPGGTTFDVWDASLAALSITTDAPLLAAPRKQTYECRARRGDGAVRDVLFHRSTFLTPAGEIGGRVGKPGQEKTGDTGGMARHFFRAGEWIHLAATWRLREGKAGTEGDFTVFLNGRKQARSWFWPFLLSGKEFFRMQEPAAQILLGCPEGAMDELRISRGVRYEADFKPARQRFTPDEQTAALFHFDGDSRGVSTTGVPIEAQ